MAITTCSITGNVRNLLNSAVANCTLRVSVITPFFHPTNGAWISGELASVLTSNTGDFSVGVIETTTPGVKLKFTFEYYDGVANRRLKDYAVVVPNQASAALSDLIGTTSVPAISPLTVQYGGTGASTLPTHSVLLGEGVAAVASASPGTAGSPLVSNGASADPSFQQLNLAGAGVTGVLPNANTTATAANTASAIMARDGSGQVAATTFTGALAGNAATVTTNANMTGPITSVGNATSVASQTGTGSKFVMDTSPTLVTPDLGTPSAAVLTNATGTASGLTAGHVTTNANMTGDVTSVGNATTYNNAVPAGKGGTGATASSSTPAASANVLWDANSNLSANNLIDGFTTTALAGGTTTMTIASTGVQVWTGSGTTAQTVKLPTTGVAAGVAYTVINTTAGTGAIAVQSSGANAIASVPAGFQGVFTALVATPTTAANWSYSLSTVNNATPPTGTVTSVTFTGDGTVLSSTPSAAVVTSGTVPATLANAAKNTYLGGPLSGSAATPTYKAFNAPSIQKFLTTGTQTGWLFNVSGWTGTIAVGDTYTNNSNTYTVLGAQTNGTGNTLFMSGTGATSGTTLTKGVSASGPATITFSTKTALATYTAPTSPAPLYVRVRMVGAGGGGGGGAGAGNANGGTGGTGSSTFFGANILTANGGVGGACIAAGGLGGSASLGTAVGIALGGGQGGGAEQLTTSTNYAQPGMGAATPLGGGGANGSAGANGQTPAANTGAGGGGGSMSNTGTTNAGSGAGAGGFIDAIITAPATTYPYLVGTGGTFGSAGTSGNQGGTGADGIIEVTEYYQ